MRILGFSEPWPKLLNPTFTTFRLTRRDRDWEVGELAQVIYKPRSKERVFLGTAWIIGKEPRDMVLGRHHKYPIVTLEEELRDGFNNYWDMWDSLVKAHPRERLYREPMNKLTIAWDLHPPEELPK